MQISKLILVLLCFFILSGCWDRREIEDIGFLLAVGLDPVNDQSQETETMEERDADIGEHKHAKMFRATYQMAVPRNLQIEGDGNGTKSYMNMTSTGMTNFKISRNTVSRNSRQNNAEHLQTIIINEELARDGMIEHLVDLFLRDHEMRRRVHVLISKGEAKAILEQNLELEDIPAMAIRKIDENYFRVLQMLKFVEIGELSTKLVRSESYVLPRIVSKGENDFKIAGAAIFDGKSNKMAGWLAETDVEGYNWIMGEARNGVLEIDYKDQDNFVFETFMMSSKITYERKKDRNQFLISILVEGTFGESWLHNITISSKMIEILERNVEEKIKQQVDAVVKKMQNEYHLDIFGFGQKIKQKEYNYWEEIKKDWDSPNGGFQQAQFEVYVDAKIRNNMTEYHKN